MSNRGKKRGKEGEEKGGKNGEEDEKSHTRTEVRRREEKGEKVTKIRKTVRR